MSVREWVVPLVLVAAGSRVLGQGTPSDAQVKALAREFVGLLAKGDFPAAAARLDSAMRRALPAPRLEALWRQLNAGLGPFERQIDVRLATVGTDRVASAACQFQKAVFDVRIAVGPRLEITGLHFAPHRGPHGYRAPAYADPSTFEEQPAKVGAAEWALGGTLSMPKGGGPFPAVVLVHGSGPNDRDEMILASRPFKDLAWGLASRAIAVLRYDKRTLAHAARMKAIPYTVREEVTEDALAAVALLRKVPRVDARRIVVLGHSQGGMLAPRIAQSDPQIAGLVILAGSARPMEDMILQQVIYLAHLDGVVSDAEREHLDQTRAAVARVKDPALSPATPARELPLGRSAAYWLDLRGYVPADLAARLPQPMLILQGGRDYQVTQKDFDIWKNRLSTRKDVQFKRYPDLNHLFVPGRGPSSPQEYARPGHVAQGVIEDIALWIKAGRPAK